MSCRQLNHPTDDGRRRFAKQKNRSLGPGVLKFETEVLCLFRVHADSSLVRRALEFHLAVDEGEQGVILADPSVRSRMKLGAPLANEYRAGTNNLTTKSLHAETLSIGVAAVS